MFFFFFNTSVAIQIKSNRATIFWEGKQEKSKKKCSKKLSSNLLLWTLYIVVLHLKTTLPPNTHNYAQSLLRAIGKEENHFSIYWYSKNCKVKESYCKRTAWIMYLIPSICRSQRNANLFELRVINEEKFAC